MPALRAEANLRAWVETNHVPTAAQGDWLDVQLVDGAVRRELDTKTCGPLHDEIARRSWRIVDSPASKAPGGKRVDDLPAGELARGCRRAAQ